MGDRVDRGIMAGDEQKDALVTISLGDMRPSGPSSCTSFEIMPSVGSFGVLSTRSMRYS